MLPGSREMKTSLNTFKKLCLKSNTTKTDEIHDYYIKLEELLQETINEETNELRNQLQEKTLLINEKNNLLNESNMEIQKLNKILHIKFFVNL